ncbi:hypothetical protein BD749_0410 [Pontibacter ramchanderi]|uniref:Uncharacterized protein n=1 Tax=Pontibacter ramchanderi TaxID=1179743 RepID=A0A2N3V1F9_9BACT|nr:hypothetical protein BD749_0410 [Pontibacter ramchanderi]
MQLTVAEPIYLYLYYTNHDDYDNAIGDETHSGSAGPQ